RALLPRLRAHLLLPERPHGRVRLRLPLLLRVAARAHRPCAHAVPRRARLPVQPRRASDASRRPAEARRRRHGRRGEHRRRPRREGLCAGTGRGGEVPAALRGRLRPDAAREPAARDVRAADLVRPAARAGGRAADRRAHGRAPHALDRELRRVQPLPRHARDAVAGARHVDRTGAASNRGRRAHLRDRGRAGGDRRRAGREVAAARAGRDPLRARLVRLPRGPARAAGRRPRHRPRLDDRAHRAHRLGQVDADLARAALLRRVLGPRDGRRRRRAGRHARVAAARDRRHLAGSVPLQRDRPRQHRLRARRPAAGRGRARGPGRAGARIHRAAAEGLRHGHRRARDHALGRPASAHRDRTCARRRPADPHPRRRDRVGRRDDRGADPRGPPRGDTRPHDADHRAPALDDRARRRDRRPRRRPRGGARHPRGARAHELRLPRDLRARAARAPVRGRGRGARRDRGGRLMRVHQAGGHLMRQPDVEVQDWTWRQTRRRIVLLWALTRPHRRRTFYSVFSLLAATATALAPPYLAKYALDDAVKGHGGTRLFVVVAIFVAAGLANWATTYLETYMTGWVGERILADLRVRLFHHLQRLSLGFYERNRAGVIISRLTNDVEAIDQLVTDGVTTLVQSTLTLIGTAVILFVLDWRLALATCAVIPLMSVSTVIFRKRSAQAYAAVRERLGLVTATLAEDIAGMRIVQAFTREQAAYENFRAVTQRYRDANMQTVVLNAVYFPIVDFLSTVALAIVLAYGGHLYFKGAMTLGTLFAFMLYVQNFFDPVQQLSQLYN